MTSDRRDPSHYRPTVHAGQRAKEREIDWELVADAIETGDIHDAPGADCYQFVLKTAGATPAVCVVVDAAAGDVLTVAWRHDD